MTDQNTTTPPPARPAPQPAARSRQATDVAVPGATGADRTRLLTLAKHHGLGNDFLVVFDPDRGAGVGEGVTEAELPGLARRLCDRRRGVGADGLLVADTSAEVRADGYDARMVLYNADGSRAEMSGNGIRCFAQAIARRRGSLAPQRILTDAGVRTVLLTATGSADTIAATVEMGAVATLAEPSGWEALGTHPDRPVAHLGLGNPHSVVGVDDVHAVDLAVLGGQVPQVNLEIVEPGPEPHAITMRVHERGVGITEACGTGACAAAYAARQWGLVAASALEVLVHMDGGTVTVAVHQPAQGSVTLTGQATFIATVEVAV